MLLTMGSITDAAAAVEERIAKACKQAGRAREAVRLTAVTKTQEPQVLADLRRAGICDFGENRVDHLHKMLAEQQSGDRFHFIGRVQSRQFAKIVPHVESIHSLAEPSHIAKLGRVCRDQQRTMSVFVQVNTAGEDQKAGVQPEDLPAMLDQARNEEGLDVVGLMCMAPDARVIGTDPAPIQRCFAALRELAERHQLERLSMGMSGDFEIAIAEGATDVRIGSILFPL